MRNVTLLCVGKLKEAYWRDACAEYEKRLGAFCRFRIVEVAEERLPDNPSAAQISATIEAEGKRLLEQTCLLYSTIYNKKLQHRPRGYTAVIYKGLQKPSPLA